MKIGIVAGEASGDLLGADLIRALQTYYPRAEFEGVGGPQMLSLGFYSLFSQERLAVMGLVEPLKRLPELLYIRNQLIEHFIRQRFALVIGIDSPDFNFTLEAKVRRAGIKTVHYVSPSVWAWRQGRIKKIAKAVDLMLTLLPFETNIYSLNKVPVQFVGHPLADQIPLVPDQQQAKKELQALLPPTQYDPSKPLLACLPGSRGGEVEYIGPICWQTIQRCRQSIPELQVVIPAVNPYRRQQLEAQLQKLAPDLKLVLIDGCSRQVMAAADAVLLASGTTALEAMLLKKPMVVIYKMAAVSYWLISRMLQVDYVSLPNLLAGDELVPELIQQQADPDRVAATLLQQLQLADDKRQQLVEQFTRLHQSIRCDASASAAEAIYKLIGKR